MLVHRRIRETRIGAIIAAAVLLLNFSALAGDGVDMEYSVDYLDSAQQHKIAKVVFPTFFAGADIMDYCGASHRTSNANQYKSSYNHAHTTEMLNPSFQDAGNNNEEVTKAKVKAYFDALYSADGYAQVEGEDPSTLGDCHSYSTGLISSNQWIWSSDGIAIIIDDDYNRGASEGAILTEKNAIDDRSDTLYHSMKAHDTVDNGCGVVIGVSKIRQKSDSSGIYEKTFSPPLATTVHDWYTKK